jgi:hypothetical protein
MKEQGMNRLVAAVLLGAPAALALSGCATTTRTTTATTNYVTGSEIGGTIPMAGITRQQAAELARAHCARYGRSSQILAIRSEDGLKAVFECTSLARGARSP